jgi:circadian clock protein KaiC
MATERIRTFVRGYDEEIGGGIPKGQVLLVEGATGTMKSSFVYYALHYNALEGTKSLFVNMEQSSESLLQQMRSLGLDTAKASKNLMVLDLSRGRERLLELAEKLEEVAKERPGARGLKNGGFLPIFKSKLVQIKRRFPFELLAVDSFDALALILELENKRIEVFNLFEWLRDLHVTTFLITEVATAPMWESLCLEEEFLADGIFQLRMDYTNDVDLRRRLRCVKMRNANHSTDYFTLVFERGQFEVTKAIS